MSRPQRRRALLIGTEHHQDPTWARLPCTRADTEQLAEVLRDRTVGGFEVTVRSDLGAQELTRTVASLGPPSGLGGDHANRR